MRRLLAVASGLLTGGFLYHRFGFDNSALLYGWQWYLGAMLLAGIGLAGILREMWLFGAIALSMAPTAIFCYDIVYLNPAESMWPIVLPMVFLFTFPVAVIGSGIGRLLMRGRLPHAVYFLALTGALIIGAFLPKLQNLQLHRTETETAGVLQQIYAAEMTYSADQPDGSFVCDGTRLPGAAGKLGWRHGERHNGRFTDYLAVDFYTISLDCSNEINPYNLQLTAYSNEGYIRAPRMSMDKTGKLVVESVTLAAQGKSQ